MGEKNDTVLKVSLSNTKTRQFVKNIGILTNFCFPQPEDEEQRRVWHELCQLYSDAMEILLLRREYTDEEIELFQDKMDDFLYLYLEKSGAGKEGVTNYV